MKDMDPRKRALIHLLKIERFVPIAVADIDAILKTLDALAGKEPPMTYSLFAKRAAYIAETAARYSCQALASDVEAPFPMSKAKDFAYDINRTVEIIVRDAQE